MNRQINLYEAKTQLSRLVDEAANGRTVIIAKHGRPMAQLGPVGAVRRREPRTLGQLAGAAKGVDWVRWWRDWKVSDKDIEREFDAAADAPLTTPGGNAIGKRRSRRAR